MSDEKNSPILVSGSVAYDRIMDFPGYFRDHFIPEKMHAISVSFNVETVADNFGGTAANIAYNLALLDLPPKIISTAGSDFERYRGHLKANHIDPTSIAVDPKALTAAAFVITDKGDNQISAFAIGAGKAPYLPLPETERVRCAIIGAGCIRDMQSLPEHYRSHKIPFMYDPGQAIPKLSAVDLREGLRGASVLFANDYEFGLIAIKTGWDIPQLLDNTPAIVITYAEKGSRVVTKEVEYKVNAVAVSEVADPTGAGDAYRAGFIAGFLKKLSLETCAKIGSTLAAYVVEKYGTQTHHFTLPELGERYKTAYGEDLPI